LLRRKNTTGFTDSATNTPYKFEKRKNERYRRDKFPAFSNFSEFSGKYVIFKNEN